MSVVLCCWQSGFVLIQKSFLLVGCFQVNSALTSTTDQEEGTLEEWLTELLLNHLTSHLELLEANKLIYIGLQF